MPLDLKKLEQKLDDALAHETKESLLEWLNSIRVIDVEVIRTYCLSFPGVEEQTPFADKNVIVYKVGNKIFCIMHLSKIENDDKFINLTAKPDTTNRLRDEYDGIKPGWHMSGKNWWSSVYFEQLPSKKVLELIKLSYKTIIIKHKLVINK